MDDILKKEDQETLYNEYTAQITPSDVNTNTENNSEHCQTSTTALLNNVNDSHNNFHKNIPEHPLQEQENGVRGWKRIYGDIFRPASHPMLFSALIGAGCQILTLIFNFTVFIELGSIYMEMDDSIYPILIDEVVYCISFIINGYFGGSLYVCMNGKKWIKQTLLSALIFPTFGCCIVLFEHYTSSYRDLYESPIAMTFVLLFVPLPVIFIGTAIGRKTTQPDNRYGTNTLPKPIPEKKWYAKSAFIILLGGLLPFATTYCIARYFAIPSSSLLGEPVTIVEYIPIVMISLLIVVLICVTILCTYFILKAEDYRWQWTSFLTGASMAVYLYLHALYFWFKSGIYFAIYYAGIYGLLFYILYLAYMGLSSVILGIMCGTVGYFGASLFVKKLYSNVKIGPTDEV